MDQKKYIIYDEEEQSEEVIAEPEVNQEQNNEPSLSEPEESTEKAASQISPLFVKRCMTSIAIIILSITLFFIYKAVTSSSSDPIANSNKPIADIDDIYNETQSYENHRISLPEIEASQLTLQQTLCNVSDSVAAITAYYNDLKNIVTNKIENENYEPTDDIKKIKAGLLEDIEALARYRIAYENFKGKELYLTFADRLQNAYNFANAIKPDKTAAELTNIANEYIGNESTLNVRAKVNAIKMLEENELEYELSGDVIIYDAQ